ncbi:phage tail fiber protein, partial [Enterobacter roggenkampii]|uniref:phage tail fiber domain-containing protein n=1 Tax=Enterobacter roggenkampii TaxID=1812935 RepID=UPI003BA36BF8
MSVPNQTPYIIYNANGLTTVFPFEFYIINSGDIQVTINGTVIASGYTVSGVGNIGGGDVIFITPPANGSVVMLERVVPTYRLTDYQDNGDLLADTVNKDFDRLWMAIQRAFIYLGLALRRPLFGGPFNAEGYRIAGLADPINDQDAATKKYVVQLGESYFNRSVRVPENFVPLTPGVDVRRNKLFAWGDSGQPIAVLPESGSAADVMIEFAKPTGAYLSGFRQTTVGGRLSTDVYITDFGGGESVSDNLAAFNLAKAAAGTGGTVTFPRNSNGVYNFSAFPDMTGVVLNPDVGVVFRGPAASIAVSPNIVTTRDYRVYFNAGDPKDYYIDMRANVHAGSKGANKSLWLTEGDIDNYIPVAVNANNILVKQIALGVGDTFANVTPAGRSASSLFLQPPIWGATQLGVIPAVPGTELKVGVNNIPDNAGEIAVGILFSTGYAVLRGYPASGIWSLSTKYAGQTPTDIVVTPDGGGTATYSPSNNIITVRSISTVRAQILINGVTAVDFQPASGVIQWVGVGATSISTVSGSNFTGWYTRQFKVASSPRSQVLGIIGDSISDAAVDGSWPVWAAEALDSSFGIRINSIENRAVSGQTIDQQIANLAANPFVNASVVVVFIGTNDIQ